MFDIFIISSYIYIYMSYTFQTIFHLVISSEFHVRSTVLTTDIVESSLDYKREEGREKKKKRKEN